MDVLTLPNGRNDVLLEILIGLDSKRPRKLVPASLAVFFQTVSEFKCCLLFCVDKCLGIS